MADDYLTLRAILAASGDRLRRFPNVVGTGIGRRQRAGEFLDEPCIRVYVTQKVKESELRDDEVIPHELHVPGLGSCTTDVVATGRPKLVLDMNKYRPVVGGGLMSSFMHAGTLGGIAFANDTLEPAWVTARHCVFDPGFFLPAPPTKVYQPGDSVDDWIGGASDVLPMQFGQTFDPGGPNYGAHPVNSVDAAKGDFSAPLVDVSFSVLDIGPAIFEVGTPDPGAPLYKAVGGTEVWKHGAGTGLTKGHVIDVDVTLDDLDYGGDWYASVGGQGSGFFTVDSDNPDEPFVLPGDSGSIVFAIRPGKSSAYPALGIVVCDADPVGAGWPRGAGVCAMPLAMELLGVETVCSGLFKKAVAQINQPARQDGASERSFDPGERYTRLRELRAFAQRQSQIGATLIDLATTVIPTVADTLYRDPVAFGLHVRLLSKVALQPTVLDMLETTIDNETVNLFERLLDRVERLQPGTRDLTTEIGRALRHATGQQVADLIGVDL